MRPPGLVNAAGNLCYLNSVLQVSGPAPDRTDSQALASSPPLLSYLTALASPTAPVVAALAELLLALNTSPTSADPPLRPLRFLTALANSSSRRRELLSSSDQQDAHELFGIIFEAISEEAERIEQASIPRDRGLADLSPVSPNRIKGKARIPSNPFDHLVAQRVKCLVCGYTRDVRHIPEVLTTLHLPNVSSCTLEQCLASHTALDLISDYNCRRCTLIATESRLLAQSIRLSTPAPPSIPPPLTTDVLLVEGVPLPAASSKSKKNRLREVKRLLEKVHSAVEAGDYERDLGVEVRAEVVRGPAGKELKFARSPALLAIHIQRSSMYGTGRAAYKNSTRVLFPEILDLEPFSMGADDFAPFKKGAGFINFAGQGDSALGDGVNGGGAGKGRDLYRLVSVVVHYGSHSYGHYITYRRTPASTSTSTTKGTNKPTIASLMALQRATSTKETKAIEPLPSSAVDASSESSSSSSGDSTSSSSSSSDDSAPFIQVKSKSTPSSILPLFDLASLNLSSHLAQGGGGDNGSNWYKASDETIDKVSLSDVLSSNPFLLFYERIPRNSTGSASIEQGRTESNEGEESEIVHSWSTFSPSSLEKKV